MLMTTAPVAIGDHVEAQDPGAVLGLKDYPAVGGEANLSALLPGGMVTSGLDCFCEPRLGLWSYHS